MTSQALTQISYSNAYSTVLSTGAVSDSHPAYGWLRIARAGLAQIGPAVARVHAAYRASAQQRSYSRSSAELMRKARSLQASHPSFANELIAIASRDR